jgi:hypothetical protein
MMGELANNFGEIHCENFTHCLKPERWNMVARVAVTRHPSQVHNLYSLGFRLYLYTLYQRPEMMLAALLLLGVTVHVFCILFLALVLLVHWV